MESFFLIVPPGLTDVALQEIKNKHPQLVANCVIQEGGIALQAILSEGCELNSTLKIPSRILLRLKENICRDLPRLFHVISRIKWSDYLLGLAPEVKVTCKTSKLMHTGKIEQTVIDGVAEFYRRQPPQTKHLETAKQMTSPFTLYLRFENDMCTISLDTSGEHLHRRGELTHKSAAPMRENLAAACALSLFSQFKNHAPRLIDPFCGGATLLHEAENFYQPNKPRNYAYENFPILKKSINIPLVYATNTTPFKTFEGYDIDKRIIDAGKDQLKSSKLNLNCQNFFNLNLSTSPYSLLTNLPYEDRVSIKGGSFHQIIERLKQHPPVSGGIISHQPLKNPGVEKVVYFKNGGIDVYLSLFQKLR
jgi:putative N6-adenine-specific DNA methylase